MFQSKDRIPYIFSFMVGLIVCLVITKFTGKKEAWDDPLYFAAGIPAMCVAACAIAYLHSTRTWRWTFAMALGQSLALVCGGGSPSLWPLALIGMLICSVPQFVVGAFTGRIRKK